jgi:hypothetical protein
MFEDARKKYLDDLESGIKPFGVSSLNSHVSIYQEIEGIAKKHAAEYLRTDGKQFVEKAEHPEEEFVELEKIVETYKLLIVPDNTLQGLLQGLGKEAARREFRRVAMLVHPDKNGHPNAKIAFQKLYRLFKGVIDGSE